MTVSVELEGYLLDTCDDMFNHTIADARFDSLLATRRPWDRRHSSISRLNPLEIENCRVNSVSGSELELASLEN